MIARKDWSDWEKRIRSELMLNHYSHSKIPVEYVRGGKVRIKSDVDFVASIKGKPVWFDAKTTNDNFWNIREYVTNPSSAHQYGKLLSCSLNGDMAGYLLWMRKKDSIVWVPVEAITFALKEGIASIHPGSRYVRHQKAEFNISFDSLIFGDQGVKQAPSTSPFSPITRG